MGGIGNQMFQYAFGRALSEKYKRKLKLDISYYKLDLSTSGVTQRNFDLEIFAAGFDLFNIDEDIGISEHIMVVKESAFTFEEKILLLPGEVPSPILFQGYWQSPKYFNFIEDRIKLDFTFKISLIGIWAQLAGIIEQNQSVMLNVRRADFLTKMNYHGVISIDYITKAVDYLQAKINSPYYFIFSDDIPWCKENIKLSEKHFFVDEKYYDPKYNGYLQLMNKCKYFILSNSTFCWWSAWLSEYDEKIIIAPEKWFTTDIDTKDLFPNSWVIV